MAVAIHYKPTQTSEFKFQRKEPLLSSGIEPGSAAYKAPDIPMCQIAPLPLYVLEVEN